MTTISSTLRPFLLKAFRDYLKSNHLTLYNSHIDFRWKQVSSGYVARRVTGNISTGTKSTGIPENFRVFGIVVNTDNNVITLRSPLWDNDGSVGREISSAYLTQLANVALSEESHGFIGTSLFWKLIARDFLLFQAMLATSEAIQHAATRLFPVDEDYEARVLPVENVTRNSPERYSPPIRIPKRRRFLPSFTDSESDLPPANSLKNARNGRALRRENNDCFDLEAEESDFSQNARSYTVDEETEDCAEDDLNDFIVSDGEGSLSDESYTPMVKEDTDDAVFDNDDPKPAFSIKSLGRSIRF
ncbi:hypothetical protein C8R43DRAFT_965047 [Mycena crocata]|nr:hypothetical protein C8R43DRAFT_965047 [Mycena crocata]